jgi:hypothetical protein
MLVCTDAGRLRLCSKKSFISHTIQTSVLSNDIHLSVILIIRWYFLTCTESLRTMRSSYPYAICLRSHWMIAIFKQEPWSVLPLFLMHLRFRFRRHTIRSLARLHHSLHREPDVNFMNDIW